MYTGQMIDNLIANVEHAEQGAPVRGAQGRRAVAAPAGNRYLYESGWRQAAEVA